MSANVRSVRNVWPLTGPIVSVTSAIISGKWNLTIWSPFSAVSADSRCPPRPDWTRGVIRLSFVTALIFALLIFALKAALEPPPGKYAFARRSAPALCGDQSIREDTG